MRIDDTKGVLRERQQVWARARDVQISEGWARVLLEVKDMYEPADYPNLPSLFAKATSENEVERFLTHWGPLGFWRLLDEKQKGMWPEKYRPGVFAEWEPVDWIIAQAHTVNFVLNLIEALKAGDEERLERELMKRRLKVVELKDLFEDGAPPLGRFATYYVAEGGGYGGEGGRLAGDREEYRGGWYRAEPYPLYEDDRATERHAQVVVAELVNANTEGLREQLHVDYHSGFGLELKAQGLIEPIWMHVRNAAFGDCEIRRCLECGAPFIVTDRRQRFCPADLPDTKSRCAARSQKRRQRGGGG